MSPTALLNLHIKSYFPYFDIILAHIVVIYSPHKEICPLLQIYPFRYRVMSPMAVLSRMNSYVPYCSVKPPHTGLCTPTVVLSLHIQSCNLFLHIKSYVPYCSVKPPHTGLCPLRQCYPHINSYAPFCSVKPPHKELFPYCSIILAHTEL